MEDIAGIAMVFILVSGLILALLLVTKNVGSGSVRIRDAELRIDFSDSPKWENSRKKPSSGKSNQPSSRYYLRVAATQWRYPLSTDPVYIGRAADCHIRLRDKTADTYQAVIYWEDNRYKINNLSTRVPTLVNGQPFSKQNVGNGNRIRTGRTEFILQDSQSTR